MPNGILVFGLNGCGKSTLGKELALKLGYKYMDIENYYFGESEIPYSIQRTREDCISLILADIKEHENFVLSAVNGDFGNEVIATIKLGIYMSAPHEVRIARVFQRSIDKFGDRVRPGGDMYDSEIEFLKTVQNRTNSKITKWLEVVSFPIIEVDGLNKITENVDYIERVLLKHI